MSYAKLDFSVAFFQRFAAEYISLTLNVFNVNELIGVLETSIDPAVTTNIWNYVYIARGSAKYYMSSTVKACKIQGEMLVKFEIVHLQSKPDSHSK